MTRYLFLDRHKNASHRGLSIARIDIVLLLLLNTRYI
jgi:hypothetical protein